MAEQQSQPLMRGLRYVHYSGLGVELAVGSAVVGSGGQSPFLHHGPQGRKEEEGLSQLLKHMNRRKMQAVCIQPSSYLC